MPENRSYWRRLGWLLLIWATSVAAMALVAQLFRMLMRLVGMSA